MIRAFALALVWMLLPLSASGAAAQTLPAAGARSLGLAGVGTATPLGPEAIAVNPAAAALPGAPRFSITLFPVSAGRSVTPISLSELADVSGEEIPLATRTLWMERIEERGSAAGSLQAGVTGLALTVGPWGFQVSSSGGGVMGLNPDAAELLLFGNAGRTGEARDMALDGSSFEAAAATTVGLSYAFRLDPFVREPFSGGDDGGLAVGALVTWTQGHALALGQDLGSRLGADPLELEVLFPVVHTDPVGPNAGSGLGVTLSAAWTWRSWSLGAVLHDAVNTFSWNEGDLVYRPGEALLDRENTESDFDGRAFSRAPEEVRSMVRSRTPSPRFTVGGSWRPSEDLELMGDVSRRMGNDMIAAPRDRLGFAAEYQGVPWLPLRGGVQLVSGGMRFGGGLGVQLGPVDLSTGAVYRTGSNRGETTVGASLTITPR